MKCQSHMHQQEGERMLGPAGPRPQVRRGLTCRGQSRNWAVGVPLPNKITICLQEMT